MSATESKTITTGPSGAAASAAADDVYADGGGDDVGSDLRSSVGELLDIVSQLRKVGLHHDLPIPQIAVCGDQSSGKSSVLEAISGVPFPRGNSLVTRCATELSMSQGREWSATIEAPDHEKITTKDKNEVAAAIEKLTNDLTGGDANAFCTDKSIQVHMTGPHYTDLTLVDLPGIIRTTTEGQSETVIKQVSQLVDHYIAQKRTIILPVIPANTDIATVDILERAKKEDPDGSRTIGVLTKPDLVDEGAEDEIIAVLNNIKKPLKLGYYMLKNRSQKNLQEGVSIVEARENERKWFNESKFALDTHCARRFGVETLRQALSEQLSSHVRQSLPTLMKEVISMRDQAKRELDGLGEAPPATVGERMRVGFQLVDKWTQAMQAECGWQVVTGRREIQQLTARRGAYARAFVKKVNQSKPDFEGPTFGLNLRHMIRQTRGRGMVGFMNFAVMQTCVKDFVQKWKPLCKSFSDQVHRLVAKTAAEIVDREAPAHAPKLKKALKRVLMNELEQMLKERSGVHDVLKDLIRGEEHVPQTLNPAMEKQVQDLQKEKRDEGFGKLAAKLAYEDPVAYKHQREDPKERILHTLSHHHDASPDTNSETREVNDVIRRLTVYWDIASKRFIDNVAMQLDNKLTSEDAIGRLNKKLSYTLTEESPDTVEAWFASSPRIEEQRTRLASKLERLDQAQEKLHDAGL